MSKAKEVKPSTQQMQQYSTMRKANQIRRSADVRYGAGIAIVSDQDLDG